MKARRLAALAALTDARTERRRRLLDGAREELHRLRAQHRELAEHARRYQREPLLQAAGTTPPLLRQRREFVARLVERVATLDEQVRRGEGRVREAGAAHTAAVARGMALESLQRHAAADEALAGARAEQRRTEETSRGRARRGFGLAAGDVRGATGYDGSVQVDERARP